jgi:peroxin-14
LERNKEAQTTQLQDLQNELKSLKSLLLNRTSQRSFSPGGTLPSSASSTALNTNIPGTNGTTSSAATTTTEPLNAANLTTTTGGTETPPLTPSRGGSPFLPSRPGIPAWQLAAREKAQQAAKGEEENVQTA